MQQQHQSNYDNNNNGYDNDYKDKRISYNTSYEDTKKYSTYPTKDKKYVCQRGQFEGFHVESVEFCKLKIAHGPQGFLGATGATGAAGQQDLNGDNGAAGPPRITQLNVTNTYQIGESFLNSFTTSDNLI